MPFVKRGGVHLGCRAGGPEPAVDLNVGRNPSDAMDRAGADRRAAANRAAIRGQAAITPIAAEIFREFGVKIETPAGEVHQRGSVAPVPRQEPARLPGRGTRDRAPFENSDISASRRETIGDGSADNAAAQD